MQTTLMPMLRSRPAAAPLRLDPALLVQTIATLRDRVAERFPGRGLGSVAEDLLRIAHASVERVAWIGRPQLPLRAAVAVLSLAIIAVPVGLVLTVEVPARVHGFAEFLQAIDAGLNDVVFIGAAIFFLITLENRAKRRRALNALRELRALAHIVDMHQLTKDPDRVSPDRTDTPSSPRATLNTFELTRYLDYCSEMLSLISKIAALYVQDFDDAVVLAAVDEVETLTAGLSRKIWQKIMILDRATV